MSWLKTQIEEYIKLLKMEKEYQLFFKNDLFLVSNTAVSKDEK